jgi:hypothetical protein
MARASSIVIGSSKIGEVVLATVKGRTIVRKYQKHITNPKTEGQVSQRNRMANCILLHRALSVAIDIGFTDRQKYASVYNSFISNNIGIMDTGRYEIAGDILANTPHPVTISTGTLGFPQVTYSAGIITVNFSEVKWYVKTGFQIRVFGLNNSGAVIMMTDYMISPTDSAAGSARIPFTSDAGSQYKCGAIILRERHEEVEPCRTNRLDGGGWQERLKPVDSQVCKTQDQVQQQP